MHGGLRAARGVRAALHRAARAADSCVVAPARSAHGGVGRRDPLSDRQHGRSRGRAELLRRARDLPRAARRAHDSRPRRRGRARLGARQLQPRPRRRRGDHDRWSSPSPAAPRRPRRRRSASRCSSRCSSRSTPPPASGAPPAGRSTSPTASRRSADSCRRRLIVLALTLVTIAFFLLSVTAVFLGDDWAQSVFGEDRPRHAGGAGVGHRALAGRAAVRARGARRRRPLRPRPRGAALADAHDRIRRDGRALGALDARASRSTSGTSAATARCTGRSRRSSSCCCGSTCMALAFLYGAELDAELRRRDAARRAAAAEQS